MNKLHYFKICINKKNQLCPLSFKCSVPIKIIFISSSIHLPMGHQCGLLYCLCIALRPPHQDPLHYLCKDPEKIARDPSVITQKGSIYSQLLSSAMPEVSSAK